MKSKIRNMRLLELFCILCCLWDTITAVRLASTKEWYTIDLLQHIDQDTQCIKDAVETIPAQDAENTAYLLKDGVNRCIEVNQDFVRGDLKEILSETDELTILAVLKQQHNNTGSILTFSANNKILFEVESNGVRDEIRVHYIHGYRTHLQVFPVHLADNEWHKVAITFTHNFIHLFIDCQPVFERQVDTIDLSFIAEDDLQLWVAQRNERHAHIKGALEYVKIVTTPQGYLEQCPYADVACPTCNQFKSLENTVSELYSFVQDLHDKLESAEKRLEEVESCDCLQSCEVDGRRYSDGDTWKLQSCTVCTCTGGEVECKQEECAVPNCKNPVLLDGYCCPICLRQLVDFNSTDLSAEHCFAHGTYYEHGEGFQPEDRVCVDCLCTDGKMTCSHRTCPALDCPANEQIEIPGECCKVCRNTDFCAAGHDCHANATCVNLETRYVCRCYQGFTGDGQRCEDIDECETAGGLNGHHCKSSAVCRNTIGSYDCECDEGFVQEDPFSCKAFDACDSTEDLCGDHARCVSLRTSYECECLSGYDGDGYDCTPVCPQGCSNGGQCVSPGVCQCRKGFIGSTCQEDLNECILGMARCSPESQCVNIPGSYMCECKPGYHSSLEDNQNGYACQDVDECRGSGDGHTCALGTQCRNTDGGYECVCTDPRLCERPCYADYTYVSHGTTFRDPEDACSTCKCENGETECTRKSCDCTDAEVDLQCCSHCSAEHDCRHQELPVSYKSGETWMYHCQTCRCNNGERECEQVQCPKLECSPAVQIEGDCCPRCMEETDACAVAAEDIRRLESCSVDGQRYFYPTPFHLEKLDRCTTCVCKNAHICCSYNQTCMQQRMDRLRNSENHRKRALEGRGGEDSHFRYDYPREDYSPREEEESSSEDIVDYRNQRHEGLSERRDKDLRSAQRERRRQLRKSQRQSERTPSHDPSQSIRDTGQEALNQNSRHQNVYSYNWRDSYSQSQDLAAVSHAKSSNSRSRHGRDRGERHRRDDSVRQSRKKA